MKACDVVAEILAEEGVPVAYELIGGMIVYLIDSISRKGSTKLVSMHHEQGAAFAADAAGRLSGVPGVAMATSGPGATNLLTGIGSCYFDSSPAVFLTGQVNRYELKGDRAIRQLGFQETDIVAMARPITKSAAMVEDAEKLPQMLREAFQLAKSGRPGPVLLDIPMDVQRADIPFVPAGKSTRSYLDTESGGWIAKLERALSASTRPLVVAGGGIRAAGAWESFVKFVEAQQLPVVYSLNGVDVLPFEHPLRVGMLGTYGNRWVNLAIGQADLLIVLGSRLDIRQTGADTKSWKGDRVIFHADCEPGELNHRVTGCETVVADLQPLLEAGASMQPSSVEQRSDWFKTLAGLRREWPDDKEIVDVAGINPNRLVHQISKGMCAASTFVADVGQHQMWAAQSTELRGGQRFITSGGMGSMGFALPAAVGAATVGCAPVVVFAGDGGFQCNIQELQTVARNSLPIKMVVINNRCHGMVRQFQENYFEKRYYSTMWGYDAPDFAAVARAYGIAGETVSSPDAVGDAVSKMSEDPDAPYLLQVMIEPSANAYPKIAFGLPMTEMEPHARALEVEST